MNYHLLLSSITCLIIHTQRSKDYEEICVKNHFNLISTKDLRLCYINNNRDHSILVRFIIDENFLNIFHFYRFLLRSIDEISLSTTNINILTNFTELIDLNNSLRILNLDSGQYEICIDFQYNLTSYIYSPRHGCISIRIGKLSHRSFKQSSIQLFIALIIGIIIFLILGLVVQYLKTKQLSSSEESSKERSRSSSILSTVSLKKQRDKIVKKLFRQHFDEYDNDTHMKQWARNRAFRHRISSIQEQNDKEIFMTTTATTYPNNHSSSTLISNLNTNDIYTIPIDISSRKISYYLPSSEEFELL